MKLHLYRPSNYRDIYQLELIHIYISKPIIPIVSKGAPSGAPSLLCRTTSTMQQAYTVNIALDG